MKSTRISALAVVALMLAAAGCAQVGDLIDAGEIEPTTADDALAVTGSLVLAAVDAISPKPCPEAEGDAFPMSPLAADATARCVQVVPGESIEVEGAPVEETPPSDGASQGAVEIRFDRTDAEELRILTGSLAERTPPGNQLAIIADGVVLSVPVVMAPIPDGIVQISGGDPGGLYEALTD